MLRIVFHPKKAKGRNTCIHGIMGYYISSLICHAVVILKTSTKFNEQQSHSKFAKLKKEYWYIGIMQGNISLQFKIAMSGWSQNFIVVVKTIDLSCMCIQLKLVNHAIVYVNIWTSS